MYAQLYVGTSLPKFNVLKHVFVEAIGDDLLHRYTRRAFVFVPQNNKALFNRGWLIGARWYSATVSVDSR